MSLIDTLYGVLGLTADEQAAVNAALPSIKDALDAVDAHLNDINGVVQLLSTNRGSLTQIIVNDWGVIGPNVSSAIVDGPVDLFGTLGAYNDIKTVIAANPKNVAAAVALYNKLLPVIDQVLADWPKIKPAVQSFMAASQRSRIPMADVAAKLQGP